MDAIIIHGISITQSTTEKANNISCKPLIYPNVIAKSIKEMVAIKKARFKPYKIPSEFCLLIE